MLPYNCASLLFIVYVFIYLGVMAMLLLTHHPPLLPCGPLQCVEVVVPPGPDWASSSPQVQRNLLYAHTTTSKLQWINTSLGCNWLHYCFCSVFALVTEMISHSCKIRLVDQLFWEICRVRPPCDSEMCGRLRLTRGLRGAIRVRLGNGHRTRVVSNCTLGEIYTPRPRHGSIMFTYTLHEVWCTANSFWTE